MVRTLLTIGIAECWRDSPKCGGETMAMTQRGDMRGKIAAAAKGVLDVSKRFMDVDRVALLFKRYVEKTSMAK